MRYDYIGIIYNPKSTGDAVKKAEMLQRAIARRKRHIGVAATLVPTKYAGHAIKLSKKISLAHKRPLIISVSGDGGYNEVVNGAMQAKQANKKANPVVAVHGAGNANDHKRATYGRKFLVVLIKNNKPRPIDLLHMTTKGDSAIDRFAHSYISLGLTSEVAKEVNTHGKGLWKEARLILKTFNDFTPVEIIRHGKTLRLHNIVFANIHTMAKVVRLDAKKSVQDGKFEVIALRHHGRFLTLLSLLKAVVLGFQNPPSKRSYRFSVTDEQIVQLDGETETVTAKSSVSVVCKKRAIDSLF